MTETCDLSLVLACYNEERVLKSNFKQIIEILNLIKLNYEVIFVDDCSKDRTRDIINEIIDEYNDVKIKKIFHSKNEGRGKSVSDGFWQACGDVVGSIDVDLEVSPTYIAKCFLEVKRGYDIVVGWRIYKFYIRSMDRYLYSKGYARLVTSICKTPYMDTESGYKFYKRSKLIPLLDEIVDKYWFWDTEIMVRAYYKSYKILLTPVLFMRRFDKKSTVKLFRDIIGYFIKLIRFGREIKYLKS